MSDGIKESDWKLFRELRQHALERFCERTLAEMGKVGTQTGKTGHERYLAVFDLLKHRDRELASIFDDARRSMAWMHLMHMRRLRLVTEAEVARFSPEFVKFSRPPSDEHAG
jgi:hypothetical protein